MFRPSWKFEGKPNSIPPQFVVLCFRVFLGGLRFRGLRFLGGLRFRGLRFLGGLRFRGLRFLGCLRFRGLRFLGGLPFRGLRFLGGLPFRGLWSSVFGLRFLDTGASKKKTCASGTQIDQLTQQRSLVCMSLLIVSMILLSINCCFEQPAI